MTELHTRPRDRRGTADRRRFVGMEEAAVYAGVSERTIRRWISNGTLMGYRIGKRLVRVDLDEIDQLMRPIPTANID